MASSSCALNVTRGRRRVALVALVVGMTWASSDWRSDSSNGLPKGQAKTTVVAAGAGADVIGGYLAYRRATEDAVRDFSHGVATFNPADFNLRFSSVVTGPQYDEVFNSFLLNRIEGLVDHRSDNRSRPRLAHVDVDRAVVEDCADDHGILGVDANALTQPTPPKRWLIRAVLRLESGSWKVSLKSSSLEQCTP